MNWEQARYLVAAIMCDEPCCINTATHWLDLEEDQSMLFLCEQHITARIVERIRDDTQESGVQA